MSTHLQTILEFTRTTGDRVIVVNENNNQAPLVILNFDEYKKIFENNQGLRSLSEQELLDKINRDIAIWRSCQGDNYQDNLNDYSKEDIHSSRGQLDNFEDDQDFSGDQDGWDWDKENFDDKFTDFEEDDFDDTEDDFTKQDMSFDAHDVFKDRPSPNTFKAREPALSVEPIVDYFDPTPKEELPVINEVDEFQEEPDLPVRI